MGVRGIDIMTFHLPRWVIVQRVHRPCRLLGRVSGTGGKNPLKYTYPSYFEKSVIERSDENFG